MKLALLIAIPALSGCPLLELEAEVGEVCVTYANVSIEGVTGDHLQHSVAAEDLAALQEFVEQDANLEFTRVALRSSSSLGFVSSARVSVASGDPESTLPTLQIVECDGDCVPDGTTIAIPAATQQSAIEYVKTGSLVLDLDLRGQLPAEAWTADIDVCMTGSFRYTVEP
jgi:hypothetical protein